MTELRADQAALLAAGSALVVAGSSLAGLYAFADRVAVVFAGILLFGAGYRIAQHGQHRMPGEPLVPLPSVARRRGASTDGGVRVAHLSRGARRPLLGVAGLFGIALGVTLFAQTIVTPATTTALQAGLASIGGYMAAHIAINGELL